MKLKHLTAIAVLAAMPFTAQAWDIRDILNQAGNALGGNTGSQQQQTSDASAALGGILGNIFQKSDLKISDIAGTWIVTGSAVSFQSDNFLQQAGGSAAASILENRLDPYFKQYGLTGATLTIDNKGNFKLRLKKLTVSGTVKEQTSKGKDKKQDKGNFLFYFNRFGTTSNNGVNTYVSKGAKDLKVMFDAKRLQDILGTIASMSKMQLAGTVSDLLNQYDGICIGFALTRAAK